MKLFDENGRHIGDIQDGVFSKKEMWGPEEGGYGISAVHAAHKLHYSHVCIGAAIQYPTFKEAEEAGIERKNLALMNQFLAEQNRKTGFVVDWGNHYQDKYCVAYDFCIKAFRIMPLGFTRVVGHVMSSKGSAELLTEMLNENRIEGYCYD